MQALMRTRAFPPGAATFAEQARALKCTAAAFTAILLHNATIDYVLAEAVNGTDLGQDLIRLPYRGKAGRW
jgi:hypothetical protein